MVIKRLSSYLVQQSDSPVDIVKDLVCSVSDKKVFYGQEGKLGSMKMLVCVPLGKHIQINTSEKGVHSLDVVVFRDFEQLKSLAGIAAETKISRHSGGKGSKTARASSSTVAFDNFLDLTANENDGIKETRVHVLRGGRLHNNVFLADLGKGSTPLDPIVTLPIDRVNFQNLMKIVDNIHIKHFETSFADSDCAVYRMNPSKSCNIAKTSATTEHIMYECTELMDTYKPREPKEDLYIILIPKDLIDDSMNSRAGTNLGKEAIFNSVLADFVTTASIAMRTDGEGSLAVVSGSKSEKKLQTANLSSYFQSYNYSASMDSMIRILKPVLQL
jgi:hypothetical protein